MDEHHAIGLAQEYLERHYSIYLTPEHVFLATEDAARGSMSEDYKLLLGKWVVLFPPSWELPELGKPTFITLLVDDKDGTVEMSEGPGKPQR